MSGPGVWRALGFAKYLPRYGYRVVVICSDRAPLRERFDPSLLEELPETTKVIRIHSPFERELVAAVARARGKLPRGKVEKFASTFERNLRRHYPDQQAAWAVKAALRALAVAATTKIRCIVTSGPPHISHLTGLLVKRLLGVRWIMDYRDLWTDDGHQVKAASYQRALFSAIEREAVKTCDAVVAVTPTFRQHLADRFQEVKSNDRFHLIRNGHDVPRDLPNVELAPVAPGRLHVHFSGTPQAGHPFGALLDGLALFRAEHPLRTPPLLTFTGLPQKLPETVLARGLSDCVRDLGHLSRRQAIEYSLRADVLVTMVADANPVYAGTVPGKTYEAMALGRHIFGLLPKRNDVRELLDQYGEATITDVSDADDIHRGLLRMVDLYERGELNKIDRARRLEIAAQYSREPRARELAELIEGGA